MGGRNRKINVAGDDDDLEDNDSDSAESDVDIDSRTTVMVRNLPSTYDFQMFIHMLDSEGFYARYDFAYLPIDFRKGSGSSFGYAFVNFVTCEDASRARLHFKGYTGWAVPCDRVCDVSWTPTQGLEAHIERFRNSPVMHSSMPEESKPTIFTAGVKSTFPLPTKRIRPPKNMLAK